MNELLFIEMIEEMGFYSTFNNISNYYTVMSFQFLEKDDEINSHKTIWTNFKFALLI